MIKAEIVADSMNQQGDRLTSLLITFPRIILSEINTHRMLSKNTSSSRAIPFNKMVEAVQENPFIPIAWQKHHSGMQGNEYFTEEGSIFHREQAWLYGRDEAVKTARELTNLDVTKQLANRLLEPFMWTTMLITGSKEGWQNFFELRCPQYYDGKQTHKSKIEYCKANNSDTSEYGKEYWQAVNKGQAEIHIMDLAEKIYDAMNESTPKQLKAGEWHIPFEDKIDLDKIKEISNYISQDNGIVKGEYSGYHTEYQMNLIKVSTSLAARTSYTVVGDEKEIDYEKMIKLHDRLIEMRHDSPLEHCARAMSDEEYYSFLKGSFSDEYIYRPYETPEISLENSDKSKLGWCYNIKGFISYRYIVDKYYR